MAGGGEEREGGRKIVGGVAFAPDALIEGLDDGVRLAEGLAKAEREDEFAVGEVGNDLADAPLARSRNAIGPGFGQGLGEGFETAGGAGDDGDGVMTSEKICVWVEFHGRESITALGRAGKRRAAEKKWSCTRCIGVARLHI